jgi:hypothetical protein
MEHRMTIKPIDILHMLDDEDISQMRQIDLHRLCTAITLDLQLERERVKGPEVFLA